MNPGWARQHALLLKMIIPSAVEDMDSWLFSYAAGEKMAQLLWKSLAVSYKSKHTFIIWPSNPTPKVLFTQEKLKLIFIQKPLSKYLQEVIPNCQKLEKTQMFFNWWMDKQLVKHPRQNGILDRNKKE